MTEGKDRYEQIRTVVEAILSDYDNDRDIDKLSPFEQPDQDEIIAIVDKMMRIIFPGYHRDKVYKSYNAYVNLSTLIEDVMYNLNKQVAIVLRYSSALENSNEEVIEKETRRITYAFFQKVPKIREYIDSDLDAYFIGDPAADSKDEIVLSYPGLYASSVYRIAHELEVLGVPLIPRMMTEYAHGATGIDIHPGATIGKYLMIDHGTGVVIGSTSIIGNHVKIYQGVTIGALSTRDGRAMHGVKRHPTIEDNVTIYSGASIFGGETIIGKGSIIGSNAFITRSIPEDTRVSIRNQELRFKKDGKEILSDSEMEQDSSWFYVI